MFLGRSHWQEHSSMKHKMNMGEILKKAVCLLYIKHLRQWQIQEWNYFVIHVSFPGLVLAGIRKGMGEINDGNWCLMFLAFGHLLSLQAHQIEGQKLVTSDFANCTCNCKPWIFMYQGFWKTWKKTFQVSLSQLFVLTCKADILKEVGKQREMVGFEKNSIQYWIQE